jgi:hypothetical protein
VLLRYGLAHLVVALPAVAVLVAGLLTAGKIGRTRPGLFKPIAVLSSLAALALLFVMGTASCIVWVVDDAGRDLTARRYLLWGERGTAETLSGAPIEFSVGEGVEVVVNATGADLVLDTVQYGGIDTSRTSPPRVPPGRALSWGWNISGVGEPPPTARVKESAPVSVQTYIRRAR